MSKLLLHGEKFCALTTVSLLLCIYIYSQCIESFYIHNCSKFMTILIYLYNISDHLSFYIKSLFTSLSIFLFKFLCLAARYALLVSAIMFALMAYYHVPTTYVLEHLFQFSFTMAMICYVANFLIYVSVSLLAINLSKKVYFTAFCCDFFVVLFCDS